MAKPETKKIYTPTKGHPMNIVFFVSGSGGNLKTILELQQDHKDLFRVALVITDRPNIKSIEIAEAYQVPVKVYNFYKECGPSPIVNKQVSPEVYWAKSQALHDNILDDILQFEEENNITFNLSILAYRRIITGKLLAHFDGRMINQHPGDLAVQTKDGKRKYIGMEAVTLALRDFNDTRTSTILVRAGMDTGEILCRGPKVTYQQGEPKTQQKIDKHENLQKAASDWPSLRFTVKGIANGYFEYSLAPVHADGLSRIFYNNQPLPYGGYEL